MFDFATASSLCVCLTSDGLSCSLSPHLPVFDHCSLPPDLLYRSHGTFGGLSVGGSLHFSIKLGHTFGDLCFSLLPLCSHSQLLPSYSYS